VHAGIQQTLPFVLFVTFVFVPSTATQIFKTFRCRSFVTDDVGFTTRRYLHDDATLDCDTDQYVTVQTAAFVMMIIWPVGTPLLCTLPGLEPCGCWIHILQIQQPVFRSLCDRFCAALGQSQSVAHRGQDTAEPRNRVSFFRSLVSSGGSRSRCAASSC
jgi:hypothetical protein